MAGRSPLRSGTRDALVSNLDVPDTAQYQADSAGAPGRGVNQGLIGISAGSYGEEANAAELAGDPAAASSLRARALELQGQAQQYGPTVNSVADVNSLGTAAEYAMGGIGSGVTTMAPTLAGAALAIGTRGRLRAPLAYAGAGVPGYLMERNEQALRQASDPLQMAQSAEMRRQAMQTKGLVGGALEAIVPGGIAATIGKATGKGFARTVGQGMLGEGATEIAQTRAGQLASQYVQQGGNLDGATVLGEDPMELIDAGILGALTGGAVSTPGAATNVAANKLAQGAEALGELGSKGLDAAKPVAEKAKDSVLGAKDRLSDELDARFRDSDGDLLDKIVNGANRAVESAKGMDFQSIVDKMKEFDTKRPEYIEQLRERVKTWPEAARAQMDTDNPDSMIAALREKDWQGLADNFKNQAGRLFKGKNNLQRDINPLLQGNAQVALLSALRPEFRDMESVRSSIPELAQRMIALSARTGGLTDQDLMAAVQLRSTLTDIFEDPAAAAEAISSVTKNGADGLSKILEIESASTDASQPNSFLELSLTPSKRAAGFNLKKIGRLVDELAMGEDVTPRNREILRGLFGSDEKAEQVLEYYRAKIYDSLEMDAPARSEPDYDTDDFDARLQGINAQDLSEEAAAAPRYFFASAKTKRPFLRGEKVKATGVEDRGPKDMADRARLKLAKALQQARKDGGDNSNVRPQIIGHGDYITKTGGDAAAEVARRIKDATKRKDAAIKKELDLKAAGKPEEQLEHERRKVREANKELQVLKMEGEDPRDVLNELYQVVEVNEVDPSGTKIDDNDVFNMGRRLRRRTTDSAKKEANESTKINFVGPSGVAISLSAHDIARVTSQKLEKVPGVNGEGESGAQRTRRAFAEGMANLMGAGYRLKEGQDLSNVVVDVFTGLKAGAVLSGPVDPKTPEYNKLPRKNPDAPTMTYAGVGSRETPREALADMRKLAKVLEEAGYKLRTGDAKGADAAFRVGAKNKEVFTADDADDTMRSIAKEIHPNPAALRSDYVLNLMARNTAQVFGKGLDTPADFIVVWTKDAQETKRGDGGTGQAMQLALGKGIPVINMAKEGWEDRLRAVMDGEAYEPVSGKQGPKITPEKIETVAAWKQLEKDWVGDSEGFLKAIQGFIDANERATKDSGPKGQRARREIRSAKETAANVIRKLYKMPEMREEEISAEELRTAADAREETSPKQELMRDLEELRDEVADFVEQRVEAQKELDIAEIAADYVEQIERRIEDLSADRTVARYYEADTGLAVGREKTGGMAAGQRAAAKTGAARDRKNQFDSLKGRRAPVQGSLPGVPAAKKVSPRVPGQPATNVLTSKEMAPSAQLPVEMAESLADAIDGAVQDGRTVTFTPGRVRRAEDFVATQKDSSIKFEAVGERQVKATFDLKSRYEDIVAMTKELGIPYEAPKKGETGATAMSAVDRFEFREQFNTKIAGLNPASALKVLESLLSRADRMGIHQADNTKGMELLVMMGEEASMLLAKTGRVGEDVNNDVERLIDAADVAAEELGFDPIDRDFATADTVKRKSDFAPATPQLGRRTAVAEKVSQETKDKRWVSLREAAENARTMIKESEAVQGELFEAANNGQPWTELDPDPKTPGPKGRGGLDRAQNTPKAERNKDGKLLGKPLELGPERSAAEAQDHNSHWTTTAEFLGLSGKEMTDPDVRRYVELSQVVAEAEKESDPKDWTAEEREAHDAEDWAGFSRLRGYTEAEIKDFSEWLALAVKLDKKYSGKYEDEYGDDYNFAEDINYGVSQLPRGWSKFNSQGFNNPGQSWTAEQQQQVLDEILRQRGPDVKASFDSFANIGGSGSYTFDKDTGERVIKVAMESVNPAGVAYHEALHDFMATLTGDKATTKMAKELGRLADNPIVLGQLRKLLAGHPEALEQIETSQEERLAYIYQFYLGGNLRIGADSSSLLGKIRDFLTKILKTVTSAERAEAYLLSLHAGDFAETTQNVANAIQASMPTYQDRLEKLSAMIGDVGAKILGSTTSRLRDTNVRALGEIADAFHVDPDREQRGSLKFLQRRRMAAGVWGNKAFDILENASQDEIRTALTNMQGMKPPSSPLEQQLRDFFDDMFRYQKGAGVKRLERVKDADEWVTKERPLKKTANYFPRIWDIDAIENMSGDFIAAVNAAGGDGAKVYEAMINHRDTGKADLDDPDSFTPWNQSLENRVLTFIDDTNAGTFTKFQNQDMAHILNTFVEEAVHRAEYARDFGNQGQWLEQKLDEAREQGATGKDIKLARDAIAGLQGTLHYDMNPKLRSLMGATITAQNLILLPMALFSQVVDAMAIGARANSWKESLKALDAGFKAVARSFTKNADRFTKDERLAMDLGIIDESAMLEAMGLAFHGQDLSKRMRDINKKFFRLNRMEQWNRAMRAQAVVTGQRFILANRDNPRYMEELGLSPSDVVELPDGGLAVDERDGLSPAQSRKVRTALFKFVDTAVLRPNAAHRPLWGNDPRFMLLMHLKQFSFTFQNTILKNMRKELQFGNMKPLMVLLSSIPAIMMSDLAKATITGGVDPNMTFMQALGNGIARSGLLGTGNFGLDAVQDVGHDNLPGTSFLGPTFEHAQMLLQSLLGSPEVTPADVLVRSVPGGSVVRNLTEG